jgi:hypothetical protein
MVKQVEKENNDSENNNNNASHDDHNYIFKNRKIVRIKRSAIFRDITRKNEYVSEDKNIKKKKAKIVVHHTHDAVVGGGDNEQQLVRLVWIQKRKAVDEHEEGQEFAHYRNIRKRVKFNDSDKTMRAGCTFKHKPDYDFIISWF